MNAPMEKQSKTIRAHLPTRATARAHLGVVAAEAARLLRLGIRVLGVALAPPTVVIVVAIANATLVDAVVAALGTVRLLVPRLLALAVADHAQVDVQRIGQTHRIDFDRLVAFARVGGTRVDHQRDVERDMVANAKTRTNVRLLLRSIQTRGGVSDLHIARGIILQLDGRRNLLVLILDQMHHIRRVLLQLARRGALDQRQRTVRVARQLLVDVNLVGGHREDDVDMVLLHFAVDLTLM